MTENGGPVSGLAVAPPGGSKSSGAILLIDASNSMKGAPIDGAMVAARAFLAERKDELPVAVIAFNPDDHGPHRLHDGLGTELSAAVAKTPPTAEGTHIYDALIEAAQAGGGRRDYERTTVVLLSDGIDAVSRQRRAEALQALNDANVRVISVGLQSPQYDPETLKSLARRTGGTYVESATPAELEPIFTAIGQQLSNEYEVTLPVASSGRTCRPSSAVDGRGLACGNGELHDAGARLHPHAAPSSGAGSTR